MGGGGAEDNMFGLLVKKSGRKCHNIEKNRLLM